MQKNILITGATSGIGYALAKHYAEQLPYVTHLILTGRNNDRLKEIEQRCEAYGATVTTKPIDVRDQKEMQEWLHEVDTKTPIDLLIANAGIATPEKTPQDIADIFEANVDGSMNTIMPVLARMVDDDCGQLGFMSSLAAHLPKDGFPNYATAKAKMMRFGLNLRDNLHKAGKKTKVSVICPGFVDTPLEAATKGPKPFKVEADVAAKMIVKGLEEDKAVITTVPKIVHSALKYYPHALRALKK